MIFLLCVRGSKSCNAQKPLIMENGASERKKGYYWCHSVKGQEVVLHLGYNHVCALQYTKESVAVSLVVAAERNNYWQMHF